MKVSLIIAVYKDVEALKLIIESLRYQTYKNFEVVIAEDGEDPLVKEYTDTIKDLDVKHTTQEDLGVRKSRSQNNAIRVSSGDYLIFIDGDCILYSDFIENHIKLSSHKIIVTGRRVNLGPSYSNMLRTNYITSLWLEKHFLKQYLKISNDAKEEKHTEEGFKIKPFGLIHKIINYNYRKKQISILGCNFSCYKQAMLDINGFDEGLGNSAFASDTDLEWRFRGLGYNIILAKYITNLFHLYHKRKEGVFIRGMMEQIEQNKINNLFKCKFGITQ